MKVVVKILQGKECVVETSPTESVLELKNKVRDLLGVDVPQQKLLLTGKPLADENLLSFYPGIKDGSKLNLVIKKEIPSSVEDKPQSDGTALLKESVSKILKHYYTESETELITNELTKDLKCKLNKLSFDDLERLATVLLQDQENLP